VIERSFMRNTFLVAFVNHQSSKRQYMFSMDDPVMRHNWTVSLKRQIEASATRPVASANDDTTDSLDTDAEDGSHSPRKVGRAYGEAKSLRRFASKKVRLFYV
jgi:hypothetical protein